MGRYKKNGVGNIITLWRGISIGKCIGKTGLIKNLGDWLSQYAGGGFTLLLMVTIVSLFISEVMSNIAQVIVFSPVVCSSWLIRLV